jgi:hypothetical protein
VALTDELKASLLKDMEQTRKNDSLPKAMDEWKNAAKIDYTGVVPTIAPAPEATPEPTTETAQEPTATPAN